MLAFIPSPSESVWHLGPVPLRAYALFIIAGALLALWIAERRFVAKGGKEGFIGDLATWALPLGIVGARAYHVVTDAQLYFGAGRDPLDALRIWQGGLGIWGAIAGGALGGWIACRRADVRFRDAAGAVAPGLLVAQAVGRLGNYFNQELFGRPTTVPWALEIDPAHRPSGYDQFGTFHPTFLYESLWNLAAAAVLVWVLDRRLRFRGDQLFSAYVMLYTAGRFWIELLRIDTVNHVGPFRLNVWTAMIVFGLATAYLVRSRIRAGSEEGGDERDSRVDAPSP